MFSTTSNRALCLIVAVLLFQEGGLALTQSQDQISPPAPPETTQQNAPQRVRVAAGVTSGLLINKVQPIYPKKARRKRIEGVVVMTARISRQGDITDLQVVSGDPMLAKAAMDAVEQWKYRPYLFNGDAVEVETQILVNFRLSKD